MGVMWATLLLLGVLGYLANVSFRLVENRLLRWHRGLRGNTQGDK
jgi:ABC-type nitrate/sulfonate/bicarbonate transport system permease component